MSISKLYSKVYRYKYIINFKTNNLNVNNYKELKDLGIWTIKTGKELILIPSNQELKEEDLSNIIRRVSGLSDFSIKKGRAPIDYFDFE